MFLTDYSPTLATTVDFQASRSGEDLVADSFNRLAAGQGLGVATETMLVAMGVKTFALPFSPARFTLRFTQTDTATLGQNSWTTNFETPPRPAFDLDIGVFVPFQDLRVERHYLGAVRDEPFVRLDRIRRPAFLSAIIDMTGLRQQTLEGGGRVTRAALGRFALRLVWPDVIVGVGIPIAQSRLLKDNSLLIGAAWRLGTNRVRLTYGVHITTAETLRSSFQVDERVAPGLTKADLVARRVFRQQVFGVSITLVSFGGNHR